MGERRSFTDILPPRARMGLGALGTAGALVAAASCSGVPTTSIDCTVPNTSSYVGYDIPAGHVDVKASSGGVFFVKLGGGDDVLTSPPYGSSFIVQDHNVQEVGGIQDTKPASRPDGVLGFVSTVPVTGSIDQAAFAGCAADPLDAEARLRAAGATVFAMDPTGVRQVLPLP